MNETQRQAYLQAMGIQCYYPRTVLPGAKPSPTYEFDPVIVPAVNRPRARDSLKAGALGDTSSSVSQAITPPARIARADRTVLHDASKSTAAIPRKAAAKPEQLPVQTAPATTEESPQWLEDELQFRLHYYRINDTLSVIDEVPHQQAGGDSVKTITLLKAILRALKVEHEACDFRADVFSWPLASGISMKNEPAVEAKKALRGFIEMRQQTDRFSNLLVFAAQVDDMLVAEDKASARDFEVSDNTYHMSITHSLQAMLAYPLLKRDVWMHLQALLARVQTASRTSK